MCADMFIIFRKDHGFDHEQLDIERLTLAKLIILLLCAVVSTYPWTLVCRVPINVLSLGCWIAALRANNMCITGGSVKGTIGQLIAPFRSDNFALMECNS